MPTRLQTKWTMENADMAALMRTIVREEITTGLEANLKPIKDELKMIKLNVTSCLGKIQSLEDSANETEIRLTQMEKENKMMAEEIIHLKQKTESLENHSRKHNLRILGLPEGMEQGRPTSFVNEMLCELFGRDVFGSLPPVNIAHCTGRNKDSRCVITKLNSFENRQRIICLAAEKKKNPEGLKYKGHNISIFPDLTIDQRKQQAAFDELRAILRKTDLRYGVAYPAKMLITFNNKTHSFTNAPDAMDFYKTVIKPTLDPSEEQY